MNRHATATYGSTKPHWQRAADSRPWPNCHWRCCQPQVVSTWELRRWASAQDSRLLSASCCAHISGRPFTKSASQARVLRRPPLQRVGGLCRTSCSFHDAQRLARITAFPRPHYPSGIVPVDTAAAHRPHTGRPDIPLTISQRLARDALPLPARRGGACRSRAVRC